MDGSEKKTPNQLSGGQRQRIAIARSLINHPKVLLLDEPLGALDLQLRRQMQYELKKLQQQLGTTFIYVTHDQEEAINMSDRIVVLRDGRIGVIGHRSYKQLDSDGVELQSYVNISFIFDYKTFAVSDLKIIGDKPSYPDTEHMLDYLKDCAFTSGIVMHEDGRADLYSGLGDVTEGRITIDAPFGELL